MSDPGAKGIRLGYGNHKFRPVDSGELFPLSTEEMDDSRALLDLLLEESKLYKSSKNYKELLDFVVRLKGFAPFNAMLLQIQKPGLTYAATAKDWLQIFGRTIKPNARPLLIMWPFGPVAFVYDIQDTKGKPVPASIYVYHVSGELDPTELQKCKYRISQNSVLIEEFDGGDASAGAIRKIAPSDNYENNVHPWKYKIEVNSNHSASVQYSTLAHELAHLYLGHLGADPKLKIPGRAGFSSTQRELEAESVAYIVSSRFGLTCHSQRYLSHYVKEHDSVGSLDLYQVLKAARSVEKLLHIPISRSAEPRRNNLLDHIKSIISILAGRK